MSAGPRFAWIAALAPVLLALGGRAIAEPQHRHPAAAVALDLDPCLGADEAAVRRAVAIELGAPLLDRPEPAAARIEIGCGDGGARLSVDDPLTRKRLQRDLAFDDADGAARARLLGLAAAELVVASWTELEAERPAPHAAQADAPEARRDEDPPRFGIGALGVARFFGSGLDTFGAGVGASFRFRSGLGVAIDLLAEQGNHDVDFGRAATFLASAAPRLEWPFIVGGMVFAPGVGARFGLAHLEGTQTMQEPLPLVATTQTAAWGGPIVTATIRATGDRLSVSIGAEVGWTLAAVAASVIGHDTAIVQGPFFGVSAELGLLP